MEFAITLVHGTFARNATWTIETSPLCEGIRARIQDSDTIHFHRFLWSGSNSVNSRFRAQQQLSAHITELSIRHPNAKQFVIAHSHGGNIAIRALADNRVRASVEGLVCLATPFISVTREEDDRLTTAIAFGGAIVVTIPLYICFGLLFGFSDPENVLNPLGLVIPPIIGSGVALAAWLSGDRWVSSNWQRMSS